MSSSISMSDKLKNIEFSYPNKDEEYRDSMEKFFILNTIEIRGEVNFACRTCTVDRSWLLYEEDEFMIYIKMWIMLPLNFKSYLKNTIG